VWRCSSPRQLPAQTTRLSERGSIGLRVALQLLLQSLSAAYDVDDRCVSWAGVSIWAAGGAGFCPACRAEPRGGAAFGMLATLDLFYRSPKRDRWARLRFSIIGPLLAAPPAPARCTALATLAAKHLAPSHLRPGRTLGAVDDRALVLRRRSAADPVAVCATGLRGPSAASRAWPGRHRDPGAAVPRAPGLDRATALRQSARRAGRQRLDRAVLSDGPPLPQGPGDVPPGGAQTRERGRGAGPRPARARLEVSSFESITSRRCGTWTSITARARCSPAPGTWVKPLLLGVLDDRSRLVCHLQWYLDETAESLVHGLSQAFMKRGCRAP
jgi:putative transposase